jgi:ABC-type amino acid transport substrate-binding protein
MAAGTRRLMLALFALGIVGAVGIAATLFALRWRGLQIPAPSQVLARGELRIGVDASYPPFATADLAGNLSGLDIDIGLAIGERLGMPVRFVNMGFDGLYDSLQADQVDIVISTLLFEFWRTRDVRYTRPYFDAGLVLVSDAGTRIHSMQDIPGKSLAYEFGAAADAEARAWSRRVAAFKTQPYELPEYALDAVRLGVADAALVDAASARLYLRKHADWDATLNHVTSTQYVVAVHYDRVATWLLIDQTLGDLLHEGIIAEIIRRWL